MPWRVFGLVAIALSALVSGCGTAPADSPQELRTSSDQTDNQRRASIRLQLAAGYYEQGQIQVALDEVKRALQADPDFADAYSLRGLIYMAMSENQLADENFMHALRLAPNNPDFNNNYGWFLCQTGQEKKSISYFDAAAHNRHYQSPAKALNNAGICSLKLNDRVAAERYFMQAFQADPANPQTNHHLAKAYFDRGDLERARFYVQRVIKAAAANAEDLWLAIKIEHKLGDREAEADLLTQLRRRYPNSVEYAAYQRGAFNE